MTMICDRCGEAFLLSNDVKYMTPFDDELNQFESNSIVKCLAGDDKGIYSIRDETVVLCPSCMEKLNDWLKGEQKCERMLDVRKAKGLPCDWQTGMDVFRWWMEDDNISGQLSMDDLMEDNNV